MKKIVIAMLLILPLIIVASVLVATGVISHEAYIAVERVELNVDTSKTIEVGLSEEQFRLVATVYPTGARNKTVLWSVENVQCFGDEVSDPVSVDSTGLVTFRTYCAFDVVATTLEGSKTARCNFFVKSDELKGVRIGMEGDSVLSVGENKQLKAVFTPLDATVGEVTWSSSAPNILAVDGNGIVTAIREGRATVTLTAGKFTANAEFNVTAAATKFGNEFTASDGFAVSAIEPAGEVVVVSGGSIEGGIFRFSAETAILNIGGTAVTVNKCARDDLAIVNAELLDGRTYYIGRLPMYIAVKYADDLRTDTPDATLNVAGPATLTGNKVIFNGKGNVIATASAGGKKASITVLSVQPVSYIRLNTVDNDDIRGIAGTTVYGTKVYENGELVDYRIPLSIQYPAAADWGDFDITVGDEEIALVSGAAIVLKGGFEGKRQLTVSVTAHYSAFETVPARTNRNFTVIDGVNCYTYEELVKATKAGYTAILRADMAPETGEFLTLTADLYGNAYLLDLTAMEKSSTQPLIKISASDVTVSNAIIRGDDVMKINMSNGMSGTIIQVGDKLDDYITGVRVEYSVLENGYYDMAVFRASVAIDGCILRNASNFGIFMPCGFSDKEKTVYYYSDVSMNNCIMSNIIATAIGIPTEASEGDGTPLKYQCKFTSTGFLDVYNWQDASSPRMLDREITGDPRIDETLKNVLGSAISKELENADYAELRYDVTADGKSERYLHLGIVTAGAMHISTTEVSIEDERFLEFSLEHLFKTHSLIKLFKLKPCTLYLYKNTADITPESSFSEDAATYRRLRGE